MKYCLFWSQSIILCKSNCDKLSHEFIYMAAASNVGQFGIIYLVFSWNKVWVRILIYRIKASCQSHLGNLSTTFPHYLSNAVSCSL